jgi:hypothetical protein
MRKFAILLVLGAAVACAEQKPASATPAPPEVEAALRDRVTKFYQAQMDGKYRQAEQFVAEDTKDYFFVMSKVPLIKFDIVKIAYSDNFTKAVVTMRLQHEMAQLFIPKMKMDSLEGSDWKIENGQWCWSVDQTVVKTPFGDFKRPPVAPGAEAAPAQTMTIPKFSDLTKTVVADKSEIELGARKTDGVVLRNSLPGPVELELDWPGAPGLEAKIEPQDVGPNGTARLLFTYDPAAGDGKEDTVTVNVTVQPTGQVIPIKVTLKPAAAPGK